jgi:hypothetical protein
MTQPLDPKTVREAAFGWPEPWNPATPLLTLAEAEALHRLAGRVVVPLAEYEQLAAIAETARIYGQSYVWSDSATGEKRVLNPADVTVVFSPGYAERMDDECRIIEAARALVASEATRADETIPHDVWLATNRAAMDALTAAVDALNAPEAIDAG